MIDIDDVLGFWFADENRPKWFVRDDAFDERVRAVLGPAHQTALDGKLDHWRETPEGCLALCILFDQAPRNMFRGTPRAFATDDRARDVARHAIGAGFDRRLPDDDHRLFLYLPFEHSEDLEDQRYAVELFGTRTSNEGYLDYAVRHRDIVERFGRFPHRNEILGRASTPEEIEFLRQPNSSF